MDAAFAKAAKIHEAEYYVPHAGARFDGAAGGRGRVQERQGEAWASTQNPQAVQDTVAEAVGIKPADVTCHVTLLGGGFGRKSKPDYVAEAAILSKQLGKPVKVVWSREDDIRFDYLSRGGGDVHEGGHDEKGHPMAWLQRSVFPPIGSQDDVNAKYGTFELDMGWDGRAVSSWPISAPNAGRRIRTFASVGCGRWRIFRMRSRCSPSPMNWRRRRGGIGWSICSRCSANRGPSICGRRKERKGPDPYILDTARMRRVIEIAAEQSGWAKKKPGNGQALGIAVHRSFLTYVAEVVEVEVDSKGQVRIPRVDIAIDTGKVIHPDRVKAQLEGAAVFGTSVALMGEITAANGRVTQSNFNNYPVARMNEAPVQTHVHIVPSSEPPAGVGEPGVPPMSPAICNAIFAATGKRIRELPIKKQLA